MKRFRFRLEALLRARRRELEEGEGLVAAALRSLEDAQAGRRVARQRGGHEAVRLAERLASGFAGGRVALSASGVEHQWQRVAEGDRRVGHEESRVSLLRADLAAARQRARVVERLREHAHERHRLAEARAEQRALDDATACLRARSGPRRPV